MTVGASHRPLRSNPNSPSSHDDGSSSTDTLRPISPVPQDQDAMTSDPSTSTSAVASSSSSSMSPNAAAPQPPAPSASSPPEIKVCVVSDAICPFCYIGYRNLQSAISTYRERSARAPETYPPFEFVVEFKPFLLDPTLGRQGVNKREKYAQKFGGMGRVQQMEAMMKQKGEACGIHFSYGGEVSSTHDFHRVMHEAYAKGGQALQLPLAEALFTAYFERERDVGQRDVLAEVASSVASRDDGSLKTFDTRADADAFLASSKWDAEVREGYATAQKLDVRGVPFFCFGSPSAFEQRYAVSGAQPPQVFLEVFEELARKGKCQAKSGCPQRQQVPPPQTPRSRARADLAPAERFKVEDGMKCTEDFVKT